ncbi:MAG: carboxypeptidase-like regulatory domain-containing protein [Flavobacteriales bacterium]|nr:carboxypeptidase-like regulatory domain-containing protein [Flavobacteriales bacterium]
MVRFLIGALLLMMSTTGLFAQRYFNLQGDVKDSMGRLVYKASIQIRNDNLGTTTDHNGKFNLRLEEGYYEIVISAMGYKNKSLNLPIDRNTQVHIILEESPLTLKEIEISNKRHDPSWDILKQVIANRSTLNSRIRNYKCEGYIKASDVLQVDSVKLKRKLRRSKREPINIDSVEAELNDGVPDMNFAEVNLVKYWGSPDKLKEERNGVRLIGDKRALFFLTVTDGEFDFYKNQVSLGKISDVKYVSPVNPAAFLSYKFKFEGSYYEGDKKIYKIRVSPRKVGNSLFRGNIEVYDGYWVLKSVEFEIHANHLPLYSSFSVRQEFEISDSGFVYLVKQQFKYSRKAKEGERIGQTIVHYEKYETNLTLPKKFFNNEVSSSMDSAYARNQDWWSTTRKDTLTSNEKVYIKYKDSINAYRNSKEYLDSIDKVFNKITALKILWWGQGWLNRQKQVRVEFAPLVTMLRPGTVGGMRAGFFMRYSKRFESRKAITLAPYLHYGFLNKDLKGSLYFSHLYNPIRRSRYYFIAAREFQMINPYEAYINMFRRSNFYDQWRVQLGHTFEVLNGLYLTNYVSYSNRKDIGNYKFSNVGDAIFKRDNEPVTFDPHQSTEIQITVSYTPFQKFIREPKEKIILGSKYPTFSVTYNQGVKGLLGSDVDFNYLQAGIKQSLNLGRFGISTYNLGTGKFFRTAYLPIVDYKYQRRGDPFLLTNPLGNYQLLPETFPTFDWYLEAHYWHSFNGFLTSAVPLFKRFNINAAAGSSILLAPEKNIRHAEVYYGIHKVFKLIRDTFKIGIFYANGVNNIGGYYQGFKISIEQYNLRDNSWSF